MAGYPTPKLPEDRAPLGSSLDAPAFIRIADAVRRYSLSRSTFDRALAAGELTRHKRGHSVLLELVEVDAWVREGAQRAAKSA